MRWPVLITVCTLASMPCATAHAQRTEEPSRSPIVVEVRDDGFDWADAGIGGAGVLGLVLAGAGAALIVRRQNEPAPRKQPDLGRSGSRGPVPQRRGP